MLCYSSNSSGDDLLVFVLLWSREDHCRNDCMMDKQRRQQTAGTAGHPVVSMFYLDVKKKI